VGGPARRKIWEARRFLRGAEGKFRSLKFPGTCKPVFRRLPEKKTKREKKGAKAARGFPRWKTKAGKKKRSEVNASRKAEKLKKTGVKAGGAKPILALGGGGANSRREDVRGFPLVKRAEGFGKVACKKRRGGHIWKRKSDGLWHVNLLDRRQLKAGRPGYAMGGYKANPTNYRREKTHHLSQWGGKGNMVDKDQFIHHRYKRTFELEG